MSLKILAVIPARGGSKGIPRKNLRFMAGKPLISYSIQNALGCAFITDCVVTTDDDEISDIAKLYGAEVVRRGENLSADAVTLDPVVYDAVLQMEKKNHITYDMVVTLQATSPLLTIETLNKAFEEFIGSDFDSCISVVNKPHLSWKKVDGQIVPNYVKRLNRQQLPPNYMETGAFFITRRKWVKENSRLGEKITVHEVPEREATDIDSVEDWIVSESILNKKNIIFRVDGMKKLGLGHIYNCITMAFSLIEHNVLLVTRADCQEGIEKIKSTHLHYRTFSNDSELQQIIDEFKPDIWVNDCLNTTAEYMKWLKERVNRVVSIEDLGEGTRYADAVINALYEKQKTLCEHTYEGSDYVCLRNEFMLEQPKPFSEKVQNVLVMFGGTDPSNLNSKLYNVAKQIVKTNPGISFHFVTGIGYDVAGNGVVSLPEQNIYVHNNVSKVTDYMKYADIAVTSQGRTVFEIATMGIPAIILAQNDRELTHTFATMKNGFINLGLGVKVNDQAVLNTIQWLIDTPNIRSNMRELMLNHDFRSSGKKIKNIILGGENL